VIRWRYLLRVSLAVTLVWILGGAESGFAAKPGDHPKLDKKLNERAVQAGQSRVIVMMNAGWDADTAAKKLGGKLGRRLGLIHGQVVELANGQLKRLADYPGVARIVHDRPTGGEMNRVAVTVGARAVQQKLGYTGAGVGIAVIDSGISSWHDDLTYDGTSNVSSSGLQTQNGQRVAGFVDFVNGQTMPYDDNGHGTHVSGIIAGNGYDTRGSRAGMAPDAHLVGLKVLDRQGRGVISSVIAALDYAVANKARYNIRVINLSVGAAVTESYMTDPLTLAAKRVVDAGIVVVTAAGNLGKNALGAAQYGGITAPANAPWVLTVGAYSHEGTVHRNDDKMARYSSRGPTAVDFQAKPDVVAPGTGVVSLSDTTSLMYTTKAAYLMKGTLNSLTKPYLSLTGTSMAAPVVAGSVALMLQANPTLTPNLVKAILQYTAQVYPDYNALTQGAGFINTKGAVDLARFFTTAQPGQRFPHAKAWSRKIIWGNRRIGGGVLKPNAPAWKLGVSWGAAKDLAQQNIVWGTYCGTDCDNIVWGTMDSADNVVWGTASADADNIVWGTYTDVSLNVVWGTLTDEDNIVWGTDCDGADCDNIVWGTSSVVDNIVWGTAAETDNIVWGTSGDVDNVVWGTSSEEDNMTWGNSGEETPLFDDPDAAPATFDATVWEDLFSETTLVVIEPVPTGTETTTTTTTTTVIGGLLGGGL